MLFSIYLISNKYIAPASTSQENSSKNLMNTSKKDIELEIFFINRKAANNSTIN